MTTLTGKRPRAFAPGPPAPGLTELRAIYSAGDADGRDAQNGVLRSVVVVSVDADLRQRLAVLLRESRWQVFEAAGGAEAMMHLGVGARDAIVVDSWLPDLQVDEFSAHVRLLHPAVELVRLDGMIGPAQLAGRNSYRDELLHAIRSAHNGQISPGNLADLPVAASMRTAQAYRLDAQGFITDGSLACGRAESLAARADSMPELVGSSAAVRELVRLVELVAARTTPVLIEGETGTGKEVAARALHRLSRRASRPFVVLNCAAIPESLLEAELFGHVRGAFTGAVQSRMGRIESANGGTLLLDEIGEMPLGMQAKMLRFIESGELQKVGENDVVRVDVRLIAATHQPLELRAEQGTFRLDLFHRLAVFPIAMPALRERMEDLPELVEHFLECLGRENPRKRLSADAMDRLRAHRWPGNVRELMHVLERGAILAGSNPEIGANEIRYRSRPRMSEIDAF